MKHRWIGLILTLSAVALLSAQNHWPQWRGPLMTGEAASANLPLTWSETENIAWKTAIPGAGHATPVVWGDKVFVLTAVPDDIIIVEKADTSAGEEGGRRHWMRGKKPDRVLHFTVLCLNLDSGNILWQTKVHSQLPHEGTHGDGTWASPSPVTDGEHVYAFFGSFGLYCLDFDGKVIWQKDLGDMKIRATFGEGSSPALHEDKLIVQWDHEGDSFLVVINKTSGDELWRKDRDERTSWSTPVVVEVDGRPQILVNATGAMRGYDLETGNVVWEATGMTVNVIPVPLVGQGVAYFMSGFRGEAMTAIRLSGARGQLDGTDHIAWIYNEDTPYTPSGLLYQQRLYFYKRNNGVMTCLNAEDGSVIWGPEKLEGQKTAYASPVGVAERIYTFGREGVAHVLDGGSLFKILATNTLDDGFDASPVVVGDRLLLRGRKSIYCIAK
ncbi:PQQ-like beta-propeller repeat protein [bacterium]|nr:PQQ-like beta-propeller repeat protein [bacterium]